MASYRGHLTFSTGLATVYGGLAWWKLGVPAPVAGVGALFTAIGGLLPDLDSDSGVPVRELFSLAGTVIPLMLLRTLVKAGMTHEETLLIVAGSYFFVRFPLAQFFKRLSVHRGMFHSIPAMLIAGLTVFLCYRHPVFELRAYLAVGMMVGFLSHLVLDELCAVDFRGLTPRLNQFAGSAVKLYSASWLSNFVCYSILLGLGYLAYGQYEAPIRNSPQASPGELQFQESPVEKRPFRWGTTPRSAPTANVPSSS